MGALIFFICLIAIFVYVIRAAKEKNRKKRIRQLEEIERSEISFNVEELNRVLNSSLEVVNNSKNYKTRISRIGVCLGHLDELKEYEDYDFVNITPSTEELTKQLHSLNDEILFEEIESQFQKAKIKSEHAKTTSAKTNSLIKILSNIEELKEHLFDDSTFDKITAEIKYYIQFIELDKYIKDGEKHEFKGDFKKALNFYQEAHYFLNTDSVFKKLKEEFLSDVEGRVNKIQKELNVA